MPSAEDYLRTRIANDAVDIAMLRAQVDALKDEVKRLQAPAEKPIEKLNAAVATVKGVQDGAVKVTAPA